jgi:two-component system, NarL family, response regulator LiaR
MYHYASSRKRRIHLSADNRFNLQPDVLIFISAYIEHMADIRVLIVDDVEQVRQDLRTFLTLTGDIEIVGEARNGMEAIRLAKALCPQVVLMDLEMPIMDGYEATRRIKMNDPSRKLIALTIHGTEAERQRAFHAGADDFIVKGAPLERLMEAIRNAPQ